MSDIKAQLTEELADIDWGSLIPHAQRDAVIVVNPGLDLIEVGIAIAQDNVIPVQRWIGEKLVCKPSPEQLSNWNLEPDKQFTTLIVQPFVLVQEIPS